MTVPGADLPEAAQRRLASPVFSSGLSVSDFAACLDMGMTPVGFVQGFCAMQWGWYGAGSTTMGGSTLFRPGTGGAYVDQFTCPHGFIGGGEHRAWGQNYEQPWVEQAWAQGFGAAYLRMMEEARTIGAHGVIGVVDEVRSLTDAAVTEFHLYGTAVVVPDAPGPHGGHPWSTYLAGQRLAKLFEAGMMPVAVCAALASVRVWAYCITEFLMENRGMGWMGSTVRAPEIEQMSRAHMAARSLVRGRVRSQLQGDALHGALLAFHSREVGPGDAVVECRLTGTRVRRFKDFDPLPPPMATVRLS